MTTVCTVSGTLKNLQGETLANTSVGFQRKGVVSQYGDAIIPYDVQVVSDGSGFVSFDIYPGNYVGIASPVSGRVEQFTMAVPETAAEDLADLIGGPGESITTGLSQLGDEIDATNDALAQEVLDRIAGDDANTEGAYYAGPWDASTGAFPAVRGAGGSVQSGDYFDVSVAGTVDGVDFEVGERIKALIDEPSATTLSGNWYHAETVAILAPLTARVDGIEESADALTARADTMPVNFDTVADFFAASLADIKKLANSTTGTAYVYVKDGQFSYTVDLGQSAAFNWTTTAGVDVTVLARDGALNMSALGIGGSDTENASIFSMAITEGFPRIIARGGPYSFDFEGAALTYSGDTLDIDLGPEKHTWKNYGGMTANNLINFKLNMRISGDDTEIKNILYSEKIQLLEIDTVEITDTFADQETIFFFQIQHEDERPFQLTCKNGVFRDIVVASNTFAMGTTSPMTAFGSFDSFSTLTTMHQMHFENLDVENFYSVSTTDDTDIIDGDSDFFRIFNNPTAIKVDNLRAVNVAKRLVKAQEQLVMTVDYCETSLDSRFEQGVNHIGTFEAQTTNQTKPSRFVLNALDVDYSAADGRPNICNASGFPHEFMISNMNYDNCTIFSSTANIKLVLKNLNGSGLQVNASASENVLVEGLVDTALPRWITGDILLENFAVTPAEVSASPLFDNAILRNGSFLGCDTGQGLAFFRRMDGVSVEYASTNSTDGRPFRPVDYEGRRAARDLTITNGTGQVVNYFYSTGASSVGSLILRDIYFDNGQLGFFQNGSWDIVEDNCAGTCIGGGISTQVVATYA